jgi:hypothetical protein
LEHRICSVEFAAFHRTANHKVVTAPRMIGPKARRRLQGSAEFGMRECRYLPVNAELQSCIVKRLYSS